MKLKRLLIVAVCVGLASAGWVLAAEAAAGPEETEREKEYTGPEQMPTEPAMSWADQIKNPTPWMTWGYDLRMREIYANNFTTLDAEGFDARGHERQFQRIRSRLWSTFTPMEDVEIDTRLVWEWRNWCGSTDAGMVSGPESIEWDEAIFDHLNFSLKNLLGEGSKLTVGRQDVIFGNGWLVLDGTPLDGSRTIFFDAARLTMPVDEENKVDLVWIEQQAASDQWIEPFNDQEKHLTEQDERGAILYWTNKSIERTQLDLYYIWKHDNYPSHAPGFGPEWGSQYPPFWSRESDIHAVGARVAGTLDDNWKYRAEFAQEMGTQKEWGNTVEGTQSLCAFGFNSRLEYLLNDEWNNNLHVGYEYLSGDDPDTKSTDEGFDPLWARWPQWSELYIYTYASETRIAETTNLHRFNIGWDADPCPKIHLCTEYNLLWADEDTVGNPIASRWGADGGFDSDGCFRGQLLATKLIYKFSDNISGHLWGEYFFPGNFYTDERNDAAVFLRYELVLTF